MTSCNLPFGSLSADRQVILTHTRFRPSSPAVYALLVLGVELCLLIGFGIFAWGLLKHCQESKSCEGDDEDDQHQIDHLPIAKECDEIHVSFPFFEFSSLGASRVHPSA